MRSSAEYYDPVAMCELEAFGDGSVGPAARRFQQNCGSCFQNGQGNPVWGEERIASELLVKLGIQVSFRTESNYVANRLDGQPRGDRRWSVFLKNHAKAIFGV
jgi:hypothetical protein